MRNRYLHVGLVHLCTTDRVGNAVRVSNCSRAEAIHISGQFTADSTLMVPSDLC